MLQSERFSQAQHRQMDRGSDQNDQDFTASHIHNILLDGISNADGSLDACADRLIQAVRFAHTHPWQIMPLGQSPLEYDIDWQNTDMTGINLNQNSDRKECPEE